MFPDRRYFIKVLASLMGSVGQNGARFEPVQTVRRESADPAEPAGSGDARRPQGGSYVRPGTIDIIHQKFDLVVVGGGIAGTCAAISAARNGSKTALVHERSTLGGNSSSEVRLFPEDTCAFSTWIKESGLLDEIHTEERVRNWEPQIEGLMNSHWDLVLYEWAIQEKNLTLFLNTTMREVEMRDPAHILAIHAIQLGTEKAFVLAGPLFIDSTGDGVLVYRAGADFRWGREARAEYKEPLAPEQATDAVMGNTLFFRARDTGRPIQFKKPEWAAQFDTEADLTGRNHGFIEGGYWWIEVSHPLHPIKDNEAIRHEGLRQLLGIWDHIKNRCLDEQTRARAGTYALEFVGFWPYKRESRRVLGDYVLRQEDVQNPQVREDHVAYGSWGIDIHLPGGILNRQIPPYPPPRSDANWKTYGTIPYGISLRCCYSRNVENLLVAGRPISASYVAFASSRVLPTGATVGQAVGAAAALCKKHQCNPRTLARQHATELQQLLLRQDCFIPGIANHDPGDLAQGARVTASSDAPLTFPEAQSFYPLRSPSAQLFPVSTARLDAVELFLKSSLPSRAVLTLGLRKADHVWDFRAFEDFAAASATIPPNFQGFVRFPLNAKTEPGRLYYIHVHATPGIAWGLFADRAGEPSLVPVGTTAADLPDANLWRPLTNGRCFSIRLTPEQRPYAPGNVVLGTSRPDRWTNIYISDPAHSLPAWIELQFRQSTKFNQVQVTLDTDVNRRIKLPLFRYPECVKRYEAALWTEKGWKVVAESRDNYFRRRVHAFPPVESDRLRITVYETNGSKSARIYEVRIYNQTNAIT